MNWINIYGVIIIVIIMIPNIIYAIKCSEGFENRWHNKPVEILEQIGRFGCMAFMIVNIPGMKFGWWMDNALTIYLVVNGVLLALYCGIWIVCFRKNNMFRAWALSGIPSIIFLFSGIMSGYVLLIITAALFAPAHILISVKNAKE